MTADEARELFSAAYESQLDAAQQQAFDTVLSGSAELSDEYGAFCAMLDAVRATQQRTPDILRGVQRRLRNASAGRYYADRFAERSGVSWLQPWLIVAAVALVLLLIWLGVRLVHVVQLAS